MNRDVRHLMTVDPGWTTGVCELTVDFSKGKTIKGLVRRGLKTGSLRSYEVAGTVRSQCWQIYSRFDDVCSDLIERRIVVPENCWMGVENFNLRDLAADTVPLEIKGGLDSLMGWPLGHNHNFVLQDPSMKAGCSNDRLKRRGLWVGSPHERDARRHMVVLIDRILAGSVTPDE